MELSKKCAVLFVGGTLVFTAMAELIKMNGDAYPQNPGWVLISTIRNAFLGSWVLLLGAGTIFLIVMAIFNVREAREKAKRAKQYEEEQRQEQIAREWRRIEEEKVRLKKLEAELLEREEARRAMYVAAHRELAEKQTRTPDDAVDQALKDFG